MGEKSKVTLIPHQTLQPILQEIAVFLKAKIRIRRQIHLCVRPFFLERMAPQPKECRQTLSNESSEADFHFDPSLQFGVWKPFGSTTTSGTFYSSLTEKATENCSPGFSMVMLRLCSMTLSSSSQVAHPVQGSSATKGASLTADHTPK